MRRLGAIFAGGQARRFGSDKAMALLDGTPLLAHVVARLAPQVDTLVVVGRDWPGLMRIDDRPHPGLGPLGALAGVLAYARAEGFTDVLTSGCDLPDTPKDLFDSLAPAPAVVDGQPLLGLWPTSLAETLLKHLEATDDRSMRGWIAHSGARAIALPYALANINTPADLAALARVRREDRRSSP